MKVLVLGADGFIGQNVARVLEVSHQVYRATRNPQTDNNTYIDLLKPETISAALELVKPDAIIQCAGIVDNSDAADQNVTFTNNLLEQIIASGQRPNIIISGSAGEFGNVAPEDIPVKETAPLNASSMYALAKKKEIELALKIRNSHSLAITIARIFNPIGIGMGEKFLISRILLQLSEIQSGKRASIEVNRLDAKRDYVDVRDIGTAIKYLIENDPQHDVYNIGSGISTTNGDLVDLIIKNSNLEFSPNIVETSEQPEQLVAIQADISRIQHEFGWSPSVTLEDTVKEIIHAQ